MIEKITYIAYDGTEFDDEDKCREYEEDQETAGYKWQWFDYKHSIIPNKNSTTIDNVFAVIFTTGEEFETFIEWCSYNTPEWEGPGLYFYDERHDTWKYWANEVQELLEFGATFGCTYPAN